MVNGLCYQLLIMHWINGLSNMDSIDRIKYLIEYDVSKTQTDNRLGETDLEYYAAKDADTDKYPIGRLKEKEKKDKTEEEEDESADDLGQESVSKGRSKSPKQPLKPNLSAK